MPFKLLARKNASQRKPPSNLTGTHYSYTLISRGLRVANHPKSLAKNPTGDFRQFKDFVRRIVAVPHSEIKAKLDAEKRAKSRKQKAASRASSVKD
jgi:hypothetical protein